MNDPEAEFEVEERQPHSAPKNRPASERSLIHQRTEISYSGPLPPPQVLSEYENVLPGAAERIFVMAEKQLDHRMSLERKVIDSGIQNSKTGVYAAVAIEGMFIAASCYLAHLGLGADAIKVLGGSAVGLLGAFGYGTISRRNERVQKQKRLTEKETDEPQS